MPKATTRVLLLCGACVLLLAPAARVDANKGAKAAKPSRLDKRVIRAAVRADMLQVALGQIASKSKTRAVSEFAQQMIKDHQALMARAKQVATSKRISVPSKLGPADRRTHKKLAKFTGSKQDKRYVALMVTTHKKYVDTLEGHVKRGRDLDIKAWSKAALPTIKTHHKRARELQARLAGSARR